MIFVVCFFKTFIIINGEGRHCRPFFIFTKKQMEKIWKEDFVVSWDKTNVKGRLSFNALSLFLVSTAINHAEHLDFGYSTISKENVSWVLFRLNIKINRLPILNEKINIKTWPGKITGITATREFEMYSEGTNEKLCMATSDWLIIDLDSRKPQRMDKYKDADFLTLNKNALDQKLPKVNIRCQFEDLFTVKTQYSDLDMNGHVIAHKYFSWLEDAVYKKFGDKEPNFIQLTFFNECNMDEEILIQHCPDDNLSFKGIKTKNEKSAFTAAVVLK